MNEISLPVITSLLLLSVAACPACKPPINVLGKDTADPDKPDDTADSGETGDSQESQPPDPTVELSVAPVFDPILGGPLAILTEFSGGDRVELQVQDSSGALIVNVADSWDGRDSLGEPLPGGVLYTLVASLYEGGIIVAEDREIVRIVRCGFTEAYAEDDDGVSSTLVPLFWFRDFRQQDFSDPFVTLSSLEDETGAARMFPPTTDQLDFFPEGENLPLATTTGSRPLLTLNLGTETLLGDVGLAGANVLLSVPGWTVLSGLPLTPGVPVVLQADTSISDLLSVVEEDLQLTFFVESSKGRGGEPWTLGVQTLPIRWEVLLGEPTFDRTDLQYTAWAAGVEPALRAIDGTKPEHDLVVDALVEWIFFDLGLAYDTRSGASFYTRGGWDNSTFYAGPFLERAWGSIVNCSDCAGILTYYANQLGADLNYIIILQNYSLNQILAIGGSEFSNCPFGPYSCGFSYHAVTTDDGGGTIWDATLALDGDEDPSSLPSEQLMVQTIDGEEYLDRLVMSGSAWYQYESKGMIQ